MKLDKGSILRLLGPLVEIVSIMAMLRFRGQDVTILGVPVEQLCYLGVMSGFAMVVTGLVISQYNRERKRTKL